MQTENLILWNLLRQSVPLAQCYMSTTPGNFSPLLLPLHSRPSDHRHVVSIRCRTECGNFPNHHPGSSTMHGRTTETMLYLASDLCIRISHQQYFSLKSNMNTENVGIYRFPNLIILQLMFAIRNVHAMSGQECQHRTCAVSEICKTWFIFHCIHQTRCGDKALTIIYSEMSWSSE